MRQIDPTITKAVNWQTDYSYCGERSHQFFAFLRVSVYGSMAVHGVIVG